MRRVAGRCGDFFDCLLPLPESLWGCVCSKWPSRVHFASAPKMKAHSGAQLTAGEYCGRSEGSQTHHESLPGGSKFRVLRQVRSRSKNFLPHVLLAVRLLGSLKLLGLVRPFSPRGTRLLASISAGAFSESWRGGAPSL